LSMSEMVFPCFFFFFFLQVFLWPWLSSGSCDWCGPGAAVSDLASVAHSARKCEGTLWQCDHKYVGCQEVGIINGTKCVYNLLVVVHFLVRLGESHLLRT
jgi:hypothetical protein